MSVYPTGLIRAFGTCARVLREVKDHGHAIEIAVRMFQSVSQVCSEFSKVCEKYNGEETETKIVHDREELVCNVSIDYFG